MSFDSRTNHLSLMGFQDEDKKLLDRIESNLLKLRDRNAKQLERSPSPPEEDSVNPTYVLTKAEIRAYTGRDKVRKSVVDDYEERLKQSPFLAVNRVSEDTLVLRTRSANEQKNEFFSIADLERANEMAEETIDPGVPADVVDHDEEEFEPEDQAYLDSCVIANELEDREARKECGEGDDDDGDEEDPNGSHEIDDPDDADSDEPDEEDDPV